MFKLFKRSNADASASEVKEVGVEKPEVALPESQSAATAGLLTRLCQGLSKTSAQLGEGIGSIFTRRRLDAAMLEELEELLILSDMGVASAAEITEAFGQERFDKDITPEEVRGALAELIAQRLRMVEQPLEIVAAQPCVIMVVGVNGNGKTTTIGKLAMHLKQSGCSVMLAAADTFRAAAVEQLRVWSERAGVPIVTGAPEADPASVAFQAMERATREGVDVLLIDTAGRLHSKHNLMQELAKIARVLGKLDEKAPHHTLMVLDGTTGQNALAQVKAFREVVPITGLAVTKLDGTAKGGVIVALAREAALPVHYIGVGEGLEDLQPFSADAFARSLTGVQ